MVAPTLPLAWSLIYWGVLAALMWAGLGVGTWIVGRVVPATVPLGAVLVGGALAGVVLTRPVHALYQELFIPLTRDPGRVRTLPVVPTTLTDWGLLFGGNAMLMLFWIGGGLFFAFFVGYGPLRRGKPLIQADPVVALRPSSALPARFVTRFSRLSASSVEVIRADDHYICAISAEGEELILYRFADAAAELEHTGWVRVHRSYCVNRDKIAEIRPRGRTLDIAMQGGMIVPVSERYRAIVEQIKR